jgi:hypothetical protein
LRLADLPSLDDCRLAFMDEGPLRGRTPTVLYLRCWRIAASRDAHTIEQAAPAARVPMDALYDRGSPAQPSLAHRYQTHVTFASRAIRSGACKSYAIKLVSLARLLFRLGAGRKGRRCREQSR